MALPTIDDEPGERTALEQYLDFYRAVLAAKLDGLSDDEAKSRPIPSTELTLAGVLKHLAYVEDFWFNDVMAGNDPVEPWASADWDNDHDWEITSAADDSSADIRALHDASCDRSRRTAAAIPSLDARCVRLRGDRDPVNLRWVVVHMIEEYARHAGHADLLREAIDGRVGDG